MFRSINIFVIQLKISMLLLQFIVCNIFVQINGLQSSSYTKYRFICSLGKTEIICNKLLHRTSSKIYSDVFQLRWNDLCFRTVKKILKTRMHTVDLNYSLIYHIHYSDWTKVHSKRHAVISAHTTTTYCIHMDRKTLNSIPIII